MKRYEVYTLRRTSTRTVYAIYSAESNHPIWKQGTTEPLTFTDRREAQKVAAEWNRR